MSNNVIEYVTKSKVKTWITCPRKYYYQYVEEIEQEETEHLITGLNVHQIIEDYYENTIKYAEENDELPTSLIELINEDNDNLTKYLNPYISHFLGFERRRWNNANQSFENWLPKSIEESRWGDDIFKNLPPLTGKSDVILPAASFKNKYINTNEGYVLIDFKTGETSGDKYKQVEEGGVYLDLIYYYLLFESQYDIVGLAAYYPKNDDLVTTEITENKKEFIKDKISEINEANPDNITDFELNQGPLCKWGEEEGQSCEYYNQCSSNWGTPIENPDLTKKLIKKGLSNKEIANELDTIEDSVSYWINKKNWYRFRKD